MIRRALTEFRDLVAMLVAEIHAGVNARTLWQDIEHEAQLRMVVGTDPTAVADARAATIELAKLGVTLDEVAPMAQLYRIADGYGVDVADVHTFLRARHRGIVPPTALTDMTAEELNDWIVAVQLAFSNATGERARRREPAVIPDVKP